MKNILCILCAGLLLTACKKDKKQDSAPASTNSPAAPTVNNATSWSGILTWSGSQQEISGILNPVSYSYRAFFANSPVPALAPSYSVTVDSVKINTTACNLFSYYYSSGGQGALASNTWQVYGNNGIPDFTFTSTTAMPSYTGYASLPDSASVNQALTVSITGVSGYDKVTVMIYDGSSFYSQVLAPGASSVTFSAGSMSGLSPTDYGSLYIDLNKKNVQLIGGKDFNFETDYQFSKQLKIYN